MDPGRVSETGEASTTPPRATVEDVTCLACGCLCDDLAVTVEGGAVVEVRSGCEVGRAWFFHESGSPDAPPAAVEGQAVGRAFALDRAAAILREARAPVLFGLTRTVTETVREALALADALGARVVLDRNEVDLGRVAAFQEQGRVTATLGEVRNRADVVVFWGADPVRTHPRHWERYSVGPKGRFVPEGRGGRTVVVVDAHETDTAGRADRFVRVPPGRVFEALVSLRMLVQGRTVAPGPEPLALDDLAAALRGARYGAMFFQPPADAGRSAGAVWEAASLLVRDLNGPGRFVLLGMGAPGNLGGAEAALTWQGGFPQGVDYRLGMPSPADDLATLNDVLESGEADAVLAVADPWPGGLTGRARAHLDAIPRVVIGPRATWSQGPAATVALATAVPGFDARGTVIRSDGVGLPTRPVRGARLPDDGACLRALLERLGPRPEGSS